MTALSLKLSYFLMTASFYSSYSIMKCFKTSLTQIQPSDNPVDLETYIPRIETLRKDFESEKAAIPQVISTKIYQDMNDKCVSYLMNLFYINTQLDRLIVQIDSVFTSLLDILIKKKEQRLLTFDESSFMYEPTTNRIVFADIFSLFTAEKSSETPENYSFIMRSRLNTFLNRVPTKSAINSKIPYDFELKKVDDLNKSEKELNFLDDKFEQLYAQANPDSRSKLRKIVADLPPAKPNESSTLSLQCVVDPLYNELTLKIDDQVSKTIRSNQIQPFSNIFLCNHNKSLYKTCMFVGYIDELKKLTKTFSIPKNYKVDINIHSNPTTSIRSGGRVKENPIYAYEIYLIVVQEDLQPLKSSKAIANPIISHSESNDLLLYLTYEGKVLVRESFWRYGVGESKAIGLFFENFNLPSQLQPVQVAHNAFYPENDKYSQFNSDAYYLSIPKNHILISLSKDQPGLHLYNLGYSLSFKFFKACNNPSKNLRIGGKEKGKSMTITYKEKTMVYPRTVDFVWNQEHLICLDGNLNDGFVFTIEDGSKKDFYWNFNEADEPGSDKPHDITRVNLIDNTENLSLTDSFENFAFPSMSKDSFYVSVSKKSGENTYSVSIYFLKYTVKLFQISTRENAKDLDTAIKNEIEIAAEGKDRQKAVNAINKIIENNTLKFDDIPTNFKVLQKDKSILEVQLKQETVAYLSKNEVVYVFYPTLPTDCYPYFPAKPKKPSPDNAKTIIIECLNKDVPIKDDGKQIHLNHDNSARGIRKVLKQTVHKRFWYKNWGLI